MTATTARTPETTTAPDAGATSSPPADLDVADLIEEVSIDGMCGVY